MGDYKPIRVYWNCWIKRGCCWIPAGVVFCFRNTTAARETSWLYNAKIVKVQDADGLTKPTVFKYKEPCKQSAFKKASDENK